LEGVVSPLILLNFVGIFGGKVFIFLDDFCKHLDLSLFPFRGVLDFALEE
jgi:hypothetical protein